MHTKQVLPLEQLTHSSEKSIKSPITWTVSGEEFASTRSKPTGTSLAEEDTHKIPNFNINLLNLTKYPTTTNLMSCVNTKDLVLCRKLL